MEPGEPVERWNLDLRYVPVKTKQSLKARARRNMRSDCSEVTVILNEAAREEEASTHERKSVDP
jgi:plasmid stability protein